MKSEILIDFRGHGERFVPHQWSKETKVINRKDTAELATPRTELSPNDVEEGKDHVYLRVGGDNWFGGVINDVRRQDDESVIFAHSWERLAEDAELTADVDEWVNAKDSAIIKDAIEDVPELKPGRIETTNPNVSILFSHDKQRTKIRDPANRSPGILRFNPDKTVDYGTLGRDKTDITLSPRKRNVENSITVDRTTIEERITHLRVVGAGEGAHQKVANIVPKSDPNTDHLANVRTYENPDWNGEADTVWDVKADKKIADSGTLGDAGLTYMEELQSARVEAKLTVKGIHVELGDRFRVYVPEERLDRNLEIVELRRHIDTDGRRYELVLSNHRKTRETADEKKTSDLEDYRHAVEGTAVPINVCGGRQPVNSNRNYDMSIYYPSEVEFEHRLNVRVIGQPYLAYSSGAEDNADFETAVIDSGELQDKPITDQWATYSTLDPEVDTSKVTALFPYRVGVSGADSTPQNAHFEFRLRARRDDGTEGYIPNKDGWLSENLPQSNTYSVVQFALPENTNGYQIELQGRQTYARDGDWYLSGATYWQGDGPHTHDPEFGIMTEDARGNTFYPGGCDVLLNGEALGVDLGDSTGRFSESVDIRGKLNPGSINTIEVTSDTLGHITAYLEGDMFRRVRGRG